MNNLNDDFLRAKRFYEEKHYGESIRHSLMILRNIRNDVYHSTHEHYIVVLFSIGILMLQNRLYTLCVHFFCDVIVECGAPEPHLWYFWFCANLNLMTAYTHSKHKDKAMEIATDMEILVKDVIEDERRERFLARLYLQVYSIDRTEAHRRRCLPYDHYYNAEERLFLAPFLS